MEPETTGRRSSSRPYPTRGSASAHSRTRSVESRPEHPPDRSSSRESQDRPQKHVAFVHILPDSRQCARLPMRVMISPHDSTDSIIATIKNFYGLYGPGISCQDRDGNIIIAAYDNFENDMTVYVKQAPVEPSVEPELTAGEKPRLGAPFEMRPPSTQKLAVQTDGFDQRPRARLPGGAGAEAEHNDGVDSDGDVSVTSSRRSKAEAHVSADITVDNIVEGGRRKRAKFESFELPLFVPPQVSAGSLSSISPQRRAPSGFEGIASPVQYSNQKPIIYGQTMASPSGGERFDVSNGAAYSRYGATMSQQQSQYSAQNQFPQQANLPPQHRSSMGHMPYPGPRQATGAILPTPEPTVGSVISDEDVALQLMRLGDSVSHGRTSTSTADDNYSRLADLSSDEEVDNGNKHGRHEFKKPKLSLDRDRRRSGGRLSDSVMNQQLVYSSDPEHKSLGIKHGENKSGSRKASKSKQVHRTSLGGSTTASATESGKAGKPKTKALAGLMSPASIEPQSRRMSVASGVFAPGEDEDDLSTKPRCQRCRKSKKGCDRRQPVCGRCKDAGLGSESCIPEDEVNGRKGRYGRPMGMSSKQKLATQQQMPTSDRPSPISDPSVHVPGEFLTPALPVGDKSRKRKR